MITQTECKKSCDKALSMIEASVKQLSEPERIKITAADFAIIYLRKLVVRGKLRNLINQSSHSHFHP